MIKFPNFERYIYPRVILERGENVYHDNLVNDIENNGTNKWKAYVTSESDDSIEYVIHMQIRNGSVVSHRCSCPYRLSRICKHRVAILFEIRARHLYNNTNNRRNTRNRVEESEEEVDEDEEDDEDDSEESGEESGTELDSAETGKSLPTKTQNSQSAPILLDDEVEGIVPDLVKKELECQICLSILDRPVLLPCQAHSLCFSCITHLITIKKKERDGYKHISCPTCGLSSGTLKLKNIQSVKVNKELERVMKAYSSERTIWIDEKLKSQIEGNSTQVLEKSEEKGLASTVRPSVGQKLSLENGSIEELTKQIQNLNLDKMKELAKAICENLVKKGGNIGSLLNSLPKEPSKEASSIPNTRSAVLKRKEPSTSEESNPKPQIEKEAERRNIARILRANNESIESSKVLKKTKK